MSSQMFCLNENCLFFLHPIVIVIKEHCVTIIYIDKFILFLLLKAYLIHAIPFNQYIQLNKGQTP